MDLWDAVTTTGLVLLAIGLWLVWPPLTFIGVGAALTFFGFAGGIRKGVQAKTDGEKPRGVRL